MSETNRSEPELPELRDVLIADWPSFKGMGRRYLRRALYAYPCEPWQFQPIVLARLAPFTLSWVEKACRLASRSQHRFALLVSVLLYDPQKGVQGLVQRAARTAAKSECSHISQAELLGHANWYLDDRRRELFQEEYGISEHELKTYKQIRDAEDDPARAPVMRPATRRKYEAKFAPALPLDKIQENDSGETPLKLLERDEVWALFSLCFDLLDPEEQELALVELGESSDGPTNIDEKRQKAILAKLKRCLRRALEQQNRDATLPGGKR